MLIFKGDHIYIGYICLFLINIFCLFIWLTGIPYIVYRHFFLLTKTANILSQSWMCFNSHFLFIQTDHVFPVIFALEFSEFAPHDKVMNIFN